MLTGLAVLTKTPALVLLPVVGLALLWAAWRDEGPWRARLVALLGRGLLWGAAAALTVVALYPALWTDAAAVLATVGGSANRHLDEALRETFFLGRAVFDPGPLFYPVALLWRLSPVVWLAALPALSLILSRRSRGRPAPSPFGRRRGRGSYSTEPEALSLTLSQGEREPAPSPFGKGLGRGSL